MITFLSGLDEDIRQALAAQVRNLWTHASTAIEGNTLTLGETAFVLEEGLTVSGKPLKDHQEVVGHAKAIELVYLLVDAGREIVEDDLFTLHRAVQTEIVWDVYKPIGDWKNAPNGVNRIIDGRQTYVEYPPPQAVPGLMRQWLAMLNESRVNTLSRSEALSAYARLHIAFVQIHPFFDGNGRMARLLANVPVLKSGHPPVVIPMERRREYLEALGRYGDTVGFPQPGDVLRVDEEALGEFRGLCEEAWRETWELVEAARARQGERDGRK